ncbi:hypothetical protein AAG906_036834 [Vitis piasezkii]
MASRGANVVVSRANRMRQKLQSALEATLLEIEDVSHQHAGHAPMRALPNAPQETHFNLKIVSPKFTGHTLVKRHRMVYDLLADELSSGLHAISIVAKTPQEDLSSGKMIGSAKEREGLYYFDEANMRGQCPPTVCNFASSLMESELLLWHKRIGHPSF